MLCYLILRGRVQYGFSVPGKLLRPALYGKRWGLVQARAALRREYQEAMPTTMQVMIILLTPFVIATSCLRLYYSQSGGCDT